MTSKQFFNNLEQNQDLNLTSFIKVFFDKFNIPYTLSNNVLKSQSPFRKGDSTASFNADGNKNVWKDFGGEQVSGRSKRQFAEAFIKNNPDLFNTNINEFEIIKIICELIPNIYNFDTLNLQTDTTNVKSTALKAILKSCLDGVAYNVVLSENKSLMEECGITQAVWNSEKEWVFNPNNEVVGFYQVKGITKYDYKLENFDFPVWHTEGNIFNKILNIENCKPRQPIKIFFDYQSFKMNTSENKIYLPITFLSDKQLKMITDISSEVSLQLANFHSNKQIAIIEKMKPILNQVDILFNVNTQEKSLISKDNLASVWQTPNKPDQTPKDLKFPISVNKFVPNVFDSEEIKPTLNLVQKQVVENIKNNSDAKTYLKKRGYDEEFITKNQLGFIDTNVFQTILGYQNINGVIKKTSPQLCSLNDLIDAKLIQPQPIKFEVGYEKDGQTRYTRKDSITPFTFKQKLESKEIKPQEMVFIQNEVDNRILAFYPCLNQRVTIPTFDANNDVNTFIGRSITTPTPEQQSTFRKYLFLKNANGEQPFNAKTNLLYNIQNIPSKVPYLILTEGQLDAASTMFFTGENVVGLGGLSISPKQIEILKSKTKNILLGFDNDDNLSGEKGTFEIGKTLLKNGFNVGVLDIKNSKHDVKDYDELFTKIQNKDECKKVMKEVINQATDFNNTFTNDLILKHIDKSGMNYTAFKNSFNEALKQLVDFDCFFEIWKQFRDINQNKLHSFIERNKQEEVVVEQKPVEIQDLKNDLKDSLRKLKF